MNATREVKLNEGALHRARCMAQGTVWLLGALVFSSCNDATGTKGVGPPARIDLVSGDGQSAEAGTRLSSPLVVKVTDAAGQPIPGQHLNFVVVSGEGSLFAPSVLSDGQGIAQNLWTLGTSTVDSQVVEVRADDPNTAVPKVFARFHAHATAGTPMQLTKISGDSQTGYSLTSERDSLAVKVTDRYGNPVTGSVVAWTATSGGGSLSPAASQTDSLGIARTLWKVGPVLGTQKAEARMTSTLFVEFSALVNQISPDAIIEKVSGDNQSGRVASTLPQPLTVVVKLPSGEVVPNATVQFDKLADGSLQPQTAETDANGRASTLVTLPIFAGQKSFRAALVSWYASHLPSSQTVFTATAQPGPPAMLYDRYLDRFSGVAGSPLPDSLQVTVVDQYTNPVSDVVHVRWSPVWGTVSPSISPTVDGVARTQWTLGSLVPDSAGVGSVAPQHLKATWDGGPDSLIFTATASSALRVNFFPFPNDYTYLSVDTVNHVDSVHVAITASSPAGAITSATAGVEATGSSWQVVVGLRTPAYFVPPNSQINLVFSNGAWRGTLSATGLTANLDRWVLVTVIDAAGNSATIPHKVSQ